ncbi:MAG TPA: gluconokinase [Steroidobacteraceae bacterium]|jgi:gluconokinase|nr:gluconokinase [Steroidobacteraceae bacterium]
MGVHDSRSVGPLALIVMGVSGSGKSTLGAALAGALDCPFLEGDEFHSSEAVSRMRAGIPLTDEDRWPWLDRLGRAIAAAVGERGIAIASCSALKRAYRDRLRAVIAAPVRFILLDASREELQRRMSSRKGHYMPPSLLDSQLATLERPEADEHAITVDALASTAAACEQILAALRGAH